MGIREQIKLKTYRFFSKKKQAPKSENVGGEERGDEKGTLGKRGKRREMGLVCGCRSQ